MMAATDIATAQNSPEIQALLARQRRLYARAKTYWLLQVTLVVVAGLVATFLLFRWGEVEAWVVVFSTVVGAFELLVLERQQERYRELGARVQELLDTRLFGLESNVALVGASPLGAELESALPAAAVRPRDTRAVADWYAQPRLEELPPSLAPLLCQVINLVYDSELRRRFAAWLWVVFWLVMSGVLLFSLARGHTVELMLTLPVAGFGPALFWLVREIRSHQAAHKRSQELVEYLRELWDEALDGDRSPDELRLAARQVQDIIYLGRSGNALVPDRFHRWQAGRVGRITRAETDQWLETALEREGEWRDRLRAAAG